jgi:DNA primase
MAIKEEGQAITLDHIVEKVSRDVTFLGGPEPTREEFLDVLSRLAKGGLVRHDAKGYYRAPPIDPYVESLLQAGEGPLNRSYSLVYAAERYYPTVVPFILPFLTGKPISAVKVFSGKADPVSDVQAIFVRYSKYKPKPVHLKVDGPEAFLRLVHDHCVDFVPYVHGFDGRPDVFLVDLDLGDRLVSVDKGMEYAKFVAKTASSLLEENSCHPLLKFSGSRGFQLLCLLAPEGVKVDFAFLREAVKGLRNELERRLRAADVRKMFPSMGLAEPYTTSSVDQKEERAGKVLVDWSSMKREGDYRAPLSLHHKTGLVSLPLREAELKEFAREMADPFRLARERPSFDFLRSFRATDPKALSPFVALK